MTVNNNITPFPFYTDIDEQNGRKPWAYGQQYPFFVPMTTLMPFQFARTTRINGISWVRLYRVDGTLIATITSQMIAAGLHITRFRSAGYDVVSFPAIVPVNLDLQLGRYYIAISDGVQVFYSEVFTATSGMDNYLKIEWWDKSNLYYTGGLIQYEDSNYPNRYKNTIYVCSNLGMPDYENEEEGEERDGIFFPNHQISYKVYRFRFLAPEFLTDALRVAWLSDYVRVTDPLGRVYNCNTFVPTVEWQDEGYLANVEVEFRTDTVVKKTGLGKEAYVGKDIRITVSDTVLTVPAAGGSVSFTVNSNDDFYIS